MKKQILVLAAIAMMAFSAKAQNEDFRSTASLTAGVNALSLFSGIVNSAADETGITLKATPSFQISYDYGLKKWFSLGFAASMNSVSSSATDFDYTDEETGIVYNGNYDFKGRRMTFALRTLFHYGNSGKLDMYSGLRLGAKRWSTDFTTTGTLKDYFDEGDIAPINNGINVQIIPFGLRYYITDNIGLGFETALGAPYFSAIQINGRF